MKKTVWIAGVAFICIATVGIGAAVRADQVESALEKKQTDVISVQQQNESKNVYGTMDVSPNWAVDPAVPANLITGDCTVVRVKVQSMGEAFFPSADDSLPITPYEVEWLETLTGKEVSAQSQIYMQGGDVSIQSVIDQRGEAYAEKYGWTELDRSQWNNQYISFAFSDCDYRLQPGEEYVLILSQRNNEAIGQYVVMANGYGTFTASATQTRSAGVAYQNVLTGASLEV